MLYFDFKKLNTQKEDHPYHLVDPSPWPLFMGVMSLYFATAANNALSYYTFGIFELTFSLILVCNVIFLWNSDSIIKSTFPNNLVQKGLKLGMLFFIISEIMFFFSFFWAFFHSCLAPSIWVGNTWPPRGLLPLDAWGWPALNTARLLTDRGWIC